MLDDLLVDGHLCIDDLDCLVVWVKVLIQVREVFEVLSLNLEHKLSELLRVVDNGLDVNPLIIQIDWECGHITKGLAGKLLCSLVEDCYNSLALGTMLDCQDLPLLVFEKYEGFESKSSSTNICY